MTREARAEWIRERAAIMEYDGGLTRAEAEQLAVECYERTFGQRKEGRDE